FTLAGDNTGTGNPGEAESCRDCEHIDCEAYDNWGGGYVQETIVYNCTIIGGRYYNNNRCAGQIGLIESTPNGVYVANFSQGTVIRGAKCYDDRQLCPVTAATAG